MFAPLSGLARRLAAPALAAWPSFVQPTPDSITLVGIAIAQPGGRSAAVFTCGSDQADHGRFAYLGDTVCDAQLVDIQSDSVTLRSAGGRVFERRLADAPPTASSVARASSPSAATSVEILPPPSIRQTDAAIHVGLSMSALDLYLSDLPALLTAARITPHLQADSRGVERPEGLEISNIRPGGVFDQLSLQNGDVIVDVNGTPVRDLTSATSLVADLKTARHATVGVRRGPERLLFVVDIE